MTTKYQFTLTSQMVEHLKLISDDNHLGKALVAIFHHKIDGHEFIDCAKDCEDMNFIIALLNDDLNKARQTNERQRRCRDNSVTVTDLSQQSPSPSEKEIKEQEDFPHTPIEEKENKEKDTPPPSPRVSDEELFEMFWKVYPRKTAKHDAENAFNSQLKKQKDRVAFVNMIVSALNVAKDSFDWTKDNGKFIPYPATWLRGERWNDEHIPVASEEQQNDITDSIADELIKEFEKGNN